MRVQLRQRRIVYSLNPLCRCTGDTLLFYLADALYHGLVQTPEALNLYTLLPIFLLVLASMTPSASR